MAYYMYVYIYGTYWAVITLLFHYIKCLLLCLLVYGNKSVRYIRMYVCTLAVIDSTYSDFCVLEICFDQPSIHVDEDEESVSFSLTILNQSSTDVMFNALITNNGTATGKINHIRTYVYRYVYLIFTWLHT